MWLVHNNYVADERLIFIIATVEVMFGFDCYYVSCSYAIVHNTVNPHNEVTNIRPNAGLAGVGFKGYIIACPL